MRTRRSVRFVCGYCGRFDLSISRYQTILGSHSYYRRHSDSNRLLFSRTDSLAVVSDTGGYRSACVYGGYRAIFSLGVSPSARRCDCGRILECGDLSSLLGPSFVERVRGSCRVLSEVRRFAPGSIAFFRGGLGVRTRLLRHRAHQRATVLRGLSRVALSLPCCSRFSTGRVHDVLFPLCGRVAFEEF